MRISEATSNSRLKNHHGLTLFEVIVVLVLLASLAGLVAPRLIAALGNPLKNEAAKIGELTRRLHYSAKMRQKTYRLAISLTDNTYWVEVGAGGVLLDGPDATPPPKPRNKEEEAALAQANPFQPDTSYLKKPRKLPLTGKFESVEIGVKNPPIRDGIAYIIFFASGLGSQAAIHMSDGKKANWTIAVQPLTGRVKIETRDVPLKDLVDEL